MLKYFETSLLESQAQTVVNTVNTVGVMGKGLAAEFKGRYPAMFQRYKELCQEGNLKIGTLWLWKGPTQWVLNFPTKDHWKQPSKIEYIEAGLKKFVAQYEARGVAEISFPRLGCGNGGLDWEDVRPIMHNYLAALPIRIYIHDFSADIGLPEHKISVAEGRPQSYAEFIADLQRLLYRTRGEFYTPDTKAPFSVRPGTKESAVIEILRPGKRTGIRDEDLYALWELLSNGPVTKQQLAGTAKTEASYVLGMLLELPYIRRSGLRDPGKRESQVAIEMSSWRHSLPSEFSEFGSDGQSSLACH